MTTEAASITTFKQVSMVDFPANSAIDLCERETNISAKLESVLNAFSFAVPAYFNPKAIQAPAMMLQ